MTMYCGLRTLSGKELSPHRLLWGNPDLMSVRTVWQPHSGKWGESKKQSSFWTIFQVRHYGGRSTGG